ncbi:MAG: type II toxin-antitoxin system VapC family toxin [Anaerolineales bacterium]
MNRYVLDANALLTYFLAEPGAEQVRRCLHEASSGAAELHMSLINYGECVYNVERRYGLAAVTRLQMFLDNYPVTYHEVDHRRVLEAAHIKARYPISYADAFAAALAQELGATLVTGDPEFHAVEHLVTVEWLTEGG